VLQDCGSHVTIIKMFTTKLIDHLLGVSLVGPVSGDFELNVLYNALRNRIQIPEVQMQTISFFILDCEC